MAREENNDQFKFGKWASSTQDTGDKSLIAVDDDQKRIITESVTGVNNEHN